MRDQCDHCTNLSLAREIGVEGLSELLSEFYAPATGIPLRYGIAFEEALEQELLAALPGLVMAPEDRSVAATLALIEQQVPVIYQGTLRGGTGEIEFSGRPDFLLRGDYRFEFTDSGLSAVQGSGPKDKYSAWDVKLSQSPKIDYQNQVGLYLDVLQKLGLASQGEHGLLLGSRKVASFDAQVLMAQLEEARTKFFSKVGLFLEHPAQTIQDLGSLVCEASSYCDICEYPALCEFRRHELGHLQLVANITKGNIFALKEDGVENLDQLVSFSGPSISLSNELLSKLQTQARLQQKTYQTGEHVFEVIDPAALALLPTPNPGDLFFDIEGFTFFEEPGGLEYLWGFSDVEGKFTGLWADDRDAEMMIFATFMQEVIARQLSHPGSRVYHYANYEQAAMKKLAARYRIFEDEVRDLLSKGVFIDLYKTVKQSLLISQESYSIKKLENYYTFERTSSVKEAMGSMEYYDQYLIALREDPTGAETLKRQVLAYNQDDCASTLALYSWLRTLS